MSKDFIHNNILQGVADAIRYCDDTTAGIAPVDYADRIRALDKLIPQPDVLNFYMPNGGTVNLRKRGTPTVVELEYTLDRGETWTVWQPNNDDGTRSLTLTAGQRVYIRNTSKTQTSFSTDTNNYYRFSFTETVEAYGNINSLLCRNAGTVTDVGSSCYRQLFYNNSFLITAPELPATVIGYASYRGMFQACTSLVTPPKLPATRLSEYCYFGMFFGCTSLIMAPELPATRLANYCYRAMFQGCQKLRELSTKMTNISATDCLADWLDGVAAQGDFYCPAELTISTGYNGIPSGWTRHDI